MYFCLILYHYTIDKGYTWYYIFSAWFLDFIISTCFEFVFIETEMNIRDCYECVRVYPLNEQGVPNGFYIKNFITVKDYIRNLRESV